MGKASLQYYCGDCENLLKEVDFEIDVSASVESCTFCGAILSDTIQKRFVNLHAKPPSIVFKKASTLPKLTLDIPKLDKIIHFLTLNNKLCISGIHTQKLIERLCIRAQLPSRYGGLNSKVLLIDGANSSDLYQCVDFARQYGLNVNKILDGIISSRSFTVYQLANTITQELPFAIKKYNVKIVVITNLLNYFASNLYFDINEMKIILKEIIKTLDKIQNCLVVVSLGIPTQYDYLFSELFSRTITIQQSYQTLSVHVNDNGKKNSLMLKQEELETIPTH
jgi:hypothetical protein